MRRSSKSLRDEEEFEEGKQDIHQFVHQFRQDHFDLYFFDETGFSLQPSVPYGWSPQGETLEIPSCKSRRLNVLGFWSPDNQLYWESHVGRVNSERVVDVFENFCQTLSRMTIVVLDNASMHTSYYFESFLDSWCERGLYLYYLPTYSPELNWIEMLWNHIKYQWLPISAYENFATLHDHVENILDQVGMKYCLNLTN